MSDMISRRDFFMLLGLCKLFALPSHNQLFISTSIRWYAMDPTTTRSQQLVHPNIQERINGRDESRV